MRSASDIATRSTLHPFISLSSSLSIRGPDIVLLGLKARYDMALAHALENGRELA